ncbi:hypothetical protein JOM56_015034 [Amanita muscaria]
MATTPVVRASHVSCGLSGLTVDSLEDVTPSFITKAPTSFSYSLRIAQKGLKEIFNKNASDFDRAQALYQVFIEIASELETTSQFNAVMTRIADNLESLGCKKKPCTLHCDRSHCEPCTLEHATPCIMPHAEPCTLSHAEPCTLTHAEPCSLPHFFVTPEPCPLQHAAPCVLNHFPVEPEKVAIPIPCPLAHNDLCTREHISNSPTPIPMEVVPTDTAPPLVASLPDIDPCYLPDTVDPPAIVSTKKQLKRKRFKHRKTIDKLTRVHENDVLCRSQNNSDYEMDSDGYCRDPLYKQELANIKREFYKDDDDNFVDTMRNLMNLADESDFLADKKPSKNGPGFIIYPSPSVSLPHPTAPHATQDTHSSLPAPHDTHPLPPASISALPLGTLVPPRSYPLTPSLAPKVSLPRAHTEPPQKSASIPLPQRAQTAPPDISRNTLTARCCTNKEASPSSFVKFMDVPVTMTREHIHDCLQNNRKWSTVDISNVEIFAIKNKDSTVVNVLKIKFKDDAQSTIKMPTMVSLYEIKLTHTLQTSHNNIGQQNNGKHRFNNVKATS